MATPVSGSGTGAVTSPSAWTARVRASHAAMVKICSLICRIIAAIGAHRLKITAKLVRLGERLVKAALRQPLERLMLKRVALAFALILGLAVPAAAAGGSVSDTFSINEITKTGGEFFGSVSQGLASLVEKAVSQFGLPNGYILGEEGSGAFILGARYGEGTLYTRNQGDYSLFWQGPSIGFDAGGDGSKVMMLVYNLSSTNDVFRRFPGVDG